MRRQIEENIPFKTLASSASLRLIKIKPLSIQRSQRKVEKKFNQQPRRERRGTVLNVSHCVFYKVVAVGFNTLRYAASVGVLNPPHE